MTNRHIARVVVPAVVLAFANIASAHPGHAGHAAGAAAGFAHPFSGPDHILAMVAVGILAAQLGGRAIWLLPCAFMALMAGGGLLNLGGVNVPFVEQAILASVLVLGLTIAFAIRLPTIAAIGLVGLFAIFHGYAHVTEMTSSGSAVNYGIGFLAATAILHAIGIGLGLGVRQLGSAKAVRFGGAAIACLGLLLMLNVL